MAGAGALSLALPGKLDATPAKRRQFEVSASLYPWDLHDEGIEHILDNLQQMSAVNSVYLLGIMHYEIRPLTSPAFPHNPARKRGLRTGVELSHTLVDLDREQSEFSDCVQRDIHGVPRKIYGRAYPLCPNNPDVQQYVLALFSDLTANYDVDYLQTCTLPFMPGGAETGGCFCDSCVKAAAEHGINLARIKSVLLANPQASAELSQRQSFREDSMARYYKIMHDGIHAIRPHVDLRFNDCFANATKWGLGLGKLAPHLDSDRK